MKQLSILAMLLSIAVVSCSDKVEENIGVDVQKMGAVTAIDQANVVSLSDVQAVNAAAGQDERNKDREQGFSVECITGERGDTLLYVVQKERGGWTIFSSDKRVPPIVAESDNGSFRDLMQIGGAKLWIEATSEEMAVIKHLDDRQLRFTSEEIENNKTFWRSITDPDDFARELLGGTLPKDDLLPKGHYELVNTEIVGQVYSVTDHMIKTAWDQWEPYNNYCPLKSTSNFYHAPAGCVAIAAGQMLYFLNDKLGVPATAPSQAYCNSHAGDEPYDWAQYDYTTTIWQYMHPDSAGSGNYAAPLIADIGRRLNMQYSDSLSGAFTSDLKSNVFQPYGLTCTRTSYNASNSLSVSKLTNSLKAGWPVLFDALSKKPDNPTEKKGHAFIVDRYKSMRTKYKNTYQWVYDDPSPGVLQPFVDRKIEYTYSSPKILWIGMNWGWGNNNTSEWFGLTSDWAYEGDNWTIDRHFIYNFSAI